LIGREEKKVGMEILTLLKCETQNALMCSDLARAQAQRYLKINTFDFYIIKIKAIFSRTYHA
jgi:hypothetical protein